MMARVKPIGRRVQTPNGPPVPPVLTSRKADQLASSYGGASGKFQRTRKPFEGLLD